MTTLSIENVTLTFGGLNALSDVSMTIEPGLITSIIGPNGAGKTSMLNCISGFYHPTKGEILYGDKRLTHSSPPGDQAGHRPGLPEPGACSAACPFLTT
jgi:branched-chain amino acid transport system ATP-binding protein